MNVLRDISLSGVGQCSLCVVIFKGYCFLQLIIYYYQDVSSPSWSSVPHRLDFMISHMLLRLCSIVFLFCLNSSYVVSSESLFLQYPKCYYAKFSNLLFQMVYF